MVENISKEEAEEILEKAKDFVHKIRTFVHKIRTGKEEEDGENGLEINSGTNPNDPNDFPSNGLPLHGCGQGLECIMLLGAGLTIRGGKKLFRGTKNS